MNKIKVTVTFVKQVTVTCFMGWKRMVMRLKLTMKAIQLTILSIWIAKTPLMAGEFYFSYGYDLPEKEP